MIEENKMDQEILETIQRVIKLHAPKYKIPGYEVEDIEQEAFILAVDALKIWDQSIGPFENFLSVFLSTRLISFVRLKLKLNSSSEKTLKAIMSATNLDSLDWDQQELLVDDDCVIENVEIEEIIKKIDEYLPISLRKDYLKMKANVQIPTYRQKKIIGFVRALLESLRGEDMDGDNE